MQYYRLLFIAFLSNKNTFDLTKIDCLSLAKEPLFSGNMFERFYLLCIII